MNRLRNRSDKSSHKSKLLYGFLILVVFQIVYRTIATGAGSDTSSLGAGQVFSKFKRSNELKIQLLATPKCKNTQQKQQGSHQERWSDRLTNRNTSAVKSMFNCDLPSATCQYYFPGNFFDKDCGIGGNYANYITEAESMRANETLWNNMPSVGFPTITMDDVCLDIGGETFGGRQRPGMTRGTTRGVKPITLTDLGEHIYPDKKRRCITERLSFIHVHKSGGTSLHRSFDHINNKNDNATIARHKWFTPTRRSSLNAPAPKKKVVRKSTDTKMYDFTLTSALQSTIYPTTEFGEYDHVIFAVVRDPIDRFISSIGQAMGASGSQNNLIGKVLQKKCIKSTSALTLTCMAKYVRDHGFWIELHFSPQVIDISFTTIWQDIPIAVFPFEELKNIVEYFGLPEVQGRHGANGGYRPDAVLSNMTVDDYDDESLSIVCEIYKVDVIMQRSLGIEVPRCDPFISRGEGN